MCACEKKKKKHEITSTPAVRLTAKRTSVVWACAQLVAEVESPLY